MIKIYKFSKNAKGTHYLLSKWVGSKLMPGVLFGTGQTVYATQNCVKEAIDYIYDVLGKKILIGKCEYKSKSGALKIVK